jgi:hypothetical protein
VEAGAFVSHPAAKTGKLLPDETNRRHVHFTFNAKTQKLQNGLPMK